MVFPLISTRYKIIMFVVLFVITASIPSIYFLRQYQKAQWKLNNPAEVAKQDTKDTITAIAKLMMLPADEEPISATIDDITKLKDQPFFANAQNGDKILIYTKSKKAILYRVETNKIIDVGPVNIGTPAATVATTPSAIPTKP